MSLNRRAFLASTAAAVAAAPFVRPGFATAAGPIGRTRPSHLKLSLAAYSYRQFLQGANKSMDLFDFADLAADMALDAIEPTSYYFPADVDEAYLRRLRRHAFRLGLDISGTAVGNNFCVPIGPEREKQLEQMRLWIDRAAAMGAPVIRIFAGNVPKGDDEDAAIERTVGAIEESLAHAAKRGVCLALENHGGITATPAQLLKIVKAVEAPEGNFGINFDSGNFHGEDPYAELAEIAPYAINAQIKSEISRKGGKKEPADLSRMVQILRDAKYSGYVALEYEAAEDPKAAIPGLIKRLREIIG
jgi:sugar phosphate isomerase/epimerase